MCNGYQNKIYSKFSRQYKQKESKLGSSKNKSEPELELELERETTMTTSNW